MYQQVKKSERLIIRFNSIRLRPFDIPKFRGYLGLKYPNYTLIHNHLSNNKYRYAYPAIQFKILDHHPVIVGLGEGIPVLKKVFIDINQLDIHGGTQKIDEKSIQIEQIKIGQVRRPIDYRFLSPWMSLNSDNYKRYRLLKWHERRQLLETILARNLKSLAKGFGYFIPYFDQLHVQADLCPVSRNFKNIKMICFEGRFSTNFVIPDYLGIGKQVARGFGTVKKTMLDGQKIIYHI